ncbi:hypothetical protein ACFPRB_16750 [Metabacillus niabensis]|uniref:Uncharacterized protein n=1 Tax=Metabacillus niabensis TaxID=324854 RepID=A0ABT9YZ17_9BACI|nr:hypothetical protein [Metabacillus niabensis]MDQ0224315.1 hypothetical protein [Metabacillus niabensis]
MRTLNRRRKNTIPFIILLVIHVVMLIYTVRKKNDKSLLVLLFSNIGFAYLFEAVVLNFLRGYTYLPKIVKNKVHDNILGAVFSQAIYVPIVATFISAFKLNWKWKVLFSTYFSIIERLFIKWKIFRTKWWKTSYTFIFTFVYFFLSDSWNKLLRKNYFLVRKITEYLSIYSIGSTGLFFLAIFKNFKLGRGRIHTWKEHYTMIPFFASSFALIQIGLNQLKSRRGKLLLFICVNGIDFLLKRLNLLKDNESLKYLILHHLLGYFISKKVLKFVSTTMKSEEIKEQTSFPNK